MLYAFVNVNLMYVQCKWFRMQTYLCIILFDALMTWVISHGHCLINPHVPLGQRTWWIAPIESKALWEHLTPRWRCPSNILVNVQPFVQLTRIEVYILVLFINVNLLYLSYKLFHMHAYLSIIIFDTPMACSFQSFHMAFLDGKALWATLTLGQNRGALTILGQFATFQYLT